MKKFYIYIMASERNGTLYVGVTNDLVKRIWEHKQGNGSKFISKYSVKNLVYYEVADYWETAIAREKNIKAWKRAWKLRLIEEKNPNWNDLYNEITGSQHSLG